jgi:tRNA (guanine-N7-)-methyltransferase
MPQPGQIETELGVPIPGPILPPEQWARTALKKLPAPGPLDWVALFGRSAPLVLDLGCGNGRFLVSSAVRRPTHDHLGIDILPMVIRYATRRANQRGLHNARLAVCGAYEFLEQYVAPHSITEIHLYHPQPFHDVERAYRRLVTPEFLALVWRALVPAGRFVIQTDNSPYWQYIARIAPSLFLFHPRTTPWTEDPHGRTRREIIARRQGLPIFRAEATPRADLDEQSLAELVQRLPPPQFDTAADGSRDPQRKSRRHRRLRRR